MLRLLYRRIFARLFRQRQPEQLVAIQKPAQYQAMQNTDEFDNALCGHLRIARYRWVPMVSDWNKDKEKKRG